MRKINWLPAALGLLFAGLACNAFANPLLTETSSPFSDPAEAPTDTEPSDPSAIFDGREPPSLETLSVLQNTFVPENDPVEMADRFLGIENVPETVPPHGPYQVGDRRTFFVLESDARVTNEVEADLLYESAQVYFWAEVGVRVDQADMEALLSAFEENMVPTNREFFGNEWLPGVDNDPHIYIVYSRQLGASVAGVFVSRDELHPLVDPKSNAAEMFMVNASNTFLEERFAYAVLAHEFQHMIHWYGDRNETSWINEGLSELAMVLNGYPEGADTFAYTIQPDSQLNDWPNDGNTGPHYAAGLLFFTYFLERFGEEATQAVVVDPANGLESIDGVLTELGIVDPLTGAAITADDLALDWAVANYLNDSRVADGRYGYSTFREIISFPVTETESISQCTDRPNVRDVHQYGVDYIHIACSDSTTLHFVGAAGVSLVPTAPYSGDFSFWSNKGDESDMTLTRAFDFGGVDGPITLTYQTWYDIEEDWDYVYVLASTNNGDDWTFLETPSGTDTDPVGNNYGFGYTGLSDGTGEWIEESVDLSQYAGQQVLLRFEYITDPSVNGEGLLVDDIAIPELGYLEDFEGGDGGWSAAGFARVETAVPQAFQLALISQGDETAVQIIEVPATNVVDIPLDFSGDVDDVTLVVMGTTRFTRQTADYLFTFFE